MEVIISFNTGTQGIIQGCVHQNKPGDVIKTTGQFSLTMRNLGPKPPINLKHQLITDNL